jgi:hypothetical protein
MRLPLAIGLAIGGLVALAIVAPATFVVIVAAALVALPGVDLLVAVLLGLAARRDPTVISLQSHARGAAILWVAASLAGILGLTTLLNFGLSAPLAVGIIGFALLLISVPALEWIVTWRDTVRELVAEALGRWRS